MQVSLAIEAGPHGLDCGSEDCHQAVAGRLDHLPARRRHRAEQDRVVTLQRVLHRAAGSAPRAVCSPQRR